MAFRGWDRDSLGGVLSSRAPGVGVAVGGGDVSGVVGNRVNDNRSVRGYSKVEVDGIVFDSKLEAVCYRQMRGQGLVFALKPCYELLPAFTFNGEAVRAWTHTPDFLLDMHGTGIIVEVKGYADARYALKLKMLKSLLSRDTSKGWRILFVHLQRDVPVFFGWLGRYGQTGDMAVLDRLSERFGHPDSEQVRAGKRRKAGVRAGVAREVARAVVAREASVSGKGVAP